MHYDTIIVKAIGKKLTLNNFDMKTFLQVYSQSYRFNYVCAYYLFILSTVHVYV